MLRGSGGTGRRARLRGVWFYRTGSIPVSRTRKQASNRLSAFLFVREMEKQNPFPRPLSVILSTIVMAEDKNAAAWRILRAFRAK